MIIANVLSVIAIVISVGVPAVEYYNDKKINSINIDIQYYDKVYSEYLLERIPECRIKVERMYDGSVLGIDDFVDLLREMRKKSLYFKFANEGFFYELRRRIQRLEDVLTMLPDKISEEEYRTFRSEIDKMIYQIYECIHEASHGRKHKRPI